MSSLLYDSVMRDYLKVGTVIMIHVVDSQLMSLMGL
jgi:hypothetical protein